MKSPALRLSSSCFALLAPAVAFSQAATRPAPSTTADREVVTLAPFEVFSQSIVSALDEKRESRVIGNFITSDALGALPDDTLGAALTRVPGVNVVDGDAVIRGVEGKFNAVRLDGAELPTAMSDFSTDIQLGRDDRAFNVDSIPAEAVESVEVLKSITADRDADAIGGMINVRTASAFRFKQPVTRYKFEYRYREQGDASGYGTYLTHASKLNRAGTVGLYLNASLRDEDRHDWSFQYTATGAPVNANGNVNVPQLSEIQPFEERINDRRITITGSLDWKLGDRTTLYAKPWVNHRTIEQNQYRYRWVRMNSTVDAIYFDNLQSRTRVTGPTDSKQADEFQLVRRLLERPGLTEKQYRLKLGGETKLVRGTVDYGAQYGTSQNGGDEYLASWTTYDRNPNNNNDRMRLQWRMLYDNSDKLLPTVEVFKLAPNLVDAATPRVDRFSAFDYDLLEEIRYLHFDSGEDSAVAETNYTGAFTVLAPMELKAGAKLRWKSRENRNRHVSWAPIMGATGFGRNLSLASPEFSGLRYGSFDAFDGRYAFLGPWVQVQPVWDFFASSPQRNWTRNERNTYSLQAAKIYDAEESIYSGYAMGSWDVGRLSVTGGARVEATDVSYTWKASAIEPPDPTFGRLRDVEGGKKYVDLFPSLVAAYRPGERHVFRAAVTKTIARPDYARLVPYNTSALREAWGGFVNDPDFEIGNPDLEKQTAWNFDLGYELYYGARRQNTVSVGLFQKRMENFLLHVGFERTVLVPADPLDPNSRLVTETQENRVVVNGAERELNGAEVSWHQRLDFLPGPLADFGFVANYTVIDGEQSQPVFDPVVLRNENRLVQTGVLADQGLTNQPKTIVNAQLYWERGRFNVRLAYQEVDRIKVSVSELRTTVERARYQAPRRTLDASLRVRLTPRLQLFVDAKNLTEEYSVSTYDLVPEYPKRHQWIGRQWVAGVSGSF